MNDHEIMNELRKLSDEELKQASLEKETKGKWAGKRYTKRANLAQYIRNERCGSKYWGVNEPKSFRG